MISEHVFTYLFISWQARVGGDNKHIVSLNLSKRLLSSLSIPSFRDKARTRGLVKPMVRLYDILNTSPKMEMLHFWCALFSHASGAMPNLSITLHVD
jgi:hypothetical protein